MTTLAEAISVQAAEDARRRAEAERAEEELLQQLLQTAIPAAFHAQIDLYFEHGAAIIPYQGQKLHITRGYQLGATESTLDTAAWVESNQAWGFPRSSTPATFWPELLRFFGAVDRGGTA